VAYSKPKKLLSLCCSEISSLRSLDSEWVHIQSQKSFCLCAARRLAHFVRLTPSGCVSKAKFHLLCAPRRLAHFVRLTPSGCVSKAKFHLLCAPRRLAHFVRLTPSGCVLKALKKITFHVIFCFCLSSRFQEQVLDAFG